MSVTEGLYCDVYEKIIWNLRVEPGATYYFDLQAR